MNGTQNNKKFNILVVIIPVVLIIIIVVGFVLSPKISTNLKNGKWVLEDGFYVYYKDGEKLTNQKIASDGKYYIVDEMGHRRENYIERSDDGKYVLGYYGPDGAKVIDDFIVIKGTERYFGVDGRLGKDIWVRNRYVDKNGKVAKNKWVDDYYLDENGNITKNQWVDNKYVGSDGKILKSTTTPDGFEVNKYGNKIVPLEEQISSKEYAFGSEITMGVFEQDNNTSNGPEPIEWILVSYDKNTVRLISKYVLFNTRYQNEEDALLGKLNYNKSYLKKWLNEDFYNKAFNDEEKSYIMKSDVGKVYIPSIEEIKKYLPDNVYRLGAATNLAKDSTMQSKTVENAAMYWLRDNGASPLHKSFISDTGDIISDDSSDEIIVNSYTIQGETEDKVARGIMTVGAKYLIGQIPFVGDIINEIGVTDSIVDSVSDSVTENNTKPKLVEEKIENPYKNLGLITNQFNGVRPMITISINKENVSSNNEESEYSFSNEVKKAKNTKKYKFNTSIEDMDTVLYGKYEQDGNINNGKEDIEWIVLDKKDNKVLLLSKYILSINKYNEVLEDITYENSTIRSYLNNSFLDEAFNEDEKNKIILTTNENDKSNDSNKTEDYAFLLSKEEVKKYFDSAVTSTMNDKKPSKSNEEKVKKGFVVSNTTVTYQASKEYENEKGKPMPKYPPIDLKSENYRDIQWMLRDMGSDLQHVCYINGFINDVGVKITTLLGIRPAMWVKY